MSLITTDFNWADEVLGDKPVVKRSIKEALASLNNNKLCWGKPMVMEVTGEDYMANMAYCSQQMEKLAKMRGPIKTALDTMQIKAWTKLRAEAAKNYLNSDRYHDTMQHIDELQWEIDGATSVGDQTEVYRLISKIEPLRKEIARIQKWVRDLEKLD